MDGSTETGVRQTYFDRLVEWLRSTDDRKKRAAATIFRRVGRLSMELLVREAISPDKQPDDRVAILDMVAQLGEPLGVSEFYLMQTLLRHKVLRVREKAAEVFASLSPCGVPNSPEAAARFREFHPAFWAPPQLHHRRRAGR